MNCGWWKKDEIVEALRLRAAGVSAAEIGRRLGRTALAVETFSRRFGAGARAMRGPTERTRRQDLRSLQGPSVLGLGSGLPPRVVTEPGYPRLL